MTSPPSLPPVPNRRLTHRLVDRGEACDPAKRFYVTAGEFSASSWSEEAAVAEIRQMQSAARRAEAGAL